AMAAMVGSGAFSDFTAAQRALAPRIEQVLPDATAAEAYGKKYRRYQALVATLHTLQSPQKEAL
ncbi:MAG: carbohydrate kinase, partial [Serratia sp. (in: enterobacteria)]